MTEDKRNVMHPLTNLKYIIMIKTIKFNARTQDQSDPVYKGRNGASKIKGIEVMTTSINAVMLSPMNKTGVTDSCFIEIPFEHLSDVIDAMREAQRSHPSSVSLWNLQGK